jgi:thiol-disulfide isomerase/thioredoxin
MTLYAMSSLSSSAVPVSHGGCGVRHSRPVKNGAPVKLWALDCPPCETELRDSPHWAPTISEIPETYDEKIEREDKEKRGEREAAAATSHALERLAPLGDLPALLAALLAANTGAGAPPVLETSTCPDGHENLVSTRFCGQCGTPMVGRMATQAVADPQDTVPAAETSLEDKSLPELRDIAQSLGVKAARSKADQIKLIQDHFGAEE